MTSAKADLTFGLGIAALATLMLTVVIPTGIDSPGDVEILALAPAFWPNIIMGLTLLIAMIMVVRAIYRLRSTSAPTPPAPGDGDVEDAQTADLSSRMAALKAAGAVIIMFAFYAVLEKLGFVASSMLVILALALLAGERRWLIVIPTAVLVPVALYLFFSNVAVVRIPVGLFEGMF